VSSKNLDANQSNMGKAPQNRDLFRRKIQLVGNANQLNFTVFL